MCPVKLDDTARCAMEAAILTLGKQYYSGFCGRLDKIIDGSIEPRAEEKARLCCMAVDVQSSLQLGTTLECGHTATQHFHALERAYCELSGTQNPQDDPDLHPDGPTIGVIKDSDTGA